MQKSHLIVTFSLLLAGLLLSGMFPAAGQAQQATEGNFVFINYIGQELSLDLDDTTYTVPGTGTSPDGGRLTLSLSPGEHKYAASVAGVPIGDAGTFVIQPGQTVGRAARLEMTEVGVNREGIVVQVPRERVRVFEFNPLASPTTPIPAVDTWQPQAAPAGMGSLAWINYNLDSLTVDLAGTVYTVPPQTGPIPGRLQINVAPGAYSFTASVPYGAVSGQVNVTAGQVIGMNVYAEPQEEPEFEEGEPSPLPLPVNLRLNQENLTAQANTQAPTTPAPSTGTATPAATTAAIPQAGQNNGVLVRNYTGDTLVFTINGRQYFILAQSEQTIQMPPGQYNYTASLPYIARTGTVDLVVGQGVDLSVATNVEGTVLNVYSN